MTTSGTEDTNAYSGRGSGAAVAASVIGLVPAIFLGSLRFILGEEPERSEELVGSVVLALNYAAPYLLVYLASKVERPGPRGALLAVFGLLSQAASFSALASLVTVVLLPATFVTWFAAARSFTASVRPLKATGFAAAAGVLVVILLGLGYFALLWLGDPEPRCWVLTLGDDGEYVWEERPNEGKSGELSLSISGTDRKSSCVSDIITNGEAGVSAGLLAVALVVMILTMRLPWIRLPESRRA